jgi:hypothetical protein
MKKVILSIIPVLISMLSPAQVLQDLNGLAYNLYGHNSLITPEVQISNSIGTAKPYEMRQETQFRRNALYVELGGQGLLYSINYEHRIGQHLSLRAGFTSWSFHGGLLTILGIEKLSMTAFPVMVNYLTSPMKSSHLEIGAGVMPSFFSGKTLFTGSEGADNQSLLVGTASIGYRYQPPDGGFFFRVALTPLLGRNIGYTGGLSFGLTF